MMKQGYLVGHQERCLGPIVITYEGPVGLTVEEILTPAGEEEPEEEEPGMEIPTAESRGNGGSDHGGLQG